MFQKCCLFVQKAVYSIPTLSQPIISTIFSEMTSRVLKSIRTKYLWNFRLYWFEIDQVFPRHLDYSQVFSNSRSSNKSHRSQRGSASKQLQNYSRDVRKCRRLSITQRWSQNQTNMFAKEYQEMPTFACPSPWQVPIAMFFLCYAQIVSSSLTTGHDRRGHVSLPTSYSRDVFSRLPLMFRHYIQIPVNEAIF